jgi:hypothetical protein
MENQNINVKYTDRLQFDNISAMVSEIRQNERELVVNQIWNEITTNASTGGSKSLWDIINEVQGIGKRGGRR